MKASRPGEQLLWAMASSSCSALASSRLSRDSRGGAMGGVGPWVGGGPWGEGGCARSGGGGELSNPRPFGNRGFGPTALLMTLEGFTPLVSSFRS